MYQTLNPATGELVQEFPVASDDELEQCLERANTSFADWRGRNIVHRSNVMEKLANLLDARADRYAQLMALEMGKPVVQGRQEIEACAHLCRSFAVEAERLISPQVVIVDEGDARVRFEPIGCILGIMPWNFPFRQVFRYAVPVIMSGNVTILKHAPNTPQTALAIVELLREAGLDGNQFQTVFASNEQVEKMILDRRVRGVTLTGSVRAGREVAAVAGRAVKPVVLELGGNDPFVVCADADQSAAVTAAVQSRCHNNGQSCISPKRIFVERAVYGSFVERFVEGMKGRVVGDPTVESTHNGPMAREDLRTTLLDQIERCKAEGAEVLLGGTALDQPGFFMSPTVLTGVKRGGVAFQEELFGPVGVVIPFDTDEQLADEANETPYGLGASIWTRHRERAAKLATQLESGMVFINGTTKSDPRVPFGGVKSSGVGRELGREGIRTFLNAKTVWTNF